MELGELLEVMGKRKWIILGIAIIFLAAGASYSFFLAKPVYRADTTLMVSSSKGVISEGESSAIDLGTISVNQMIAITYGEIAKSRAVLETVIDDLGLDMSYEDLLSSVTSEPVESTEIIKISVEAGSREDAVTIANRITDVFVEEVVRILKVNNVEVIDSAAAEQNPVNMSPIFIMVAFAAAGTVIGILVALWVDYRDNTIKTTDDIEKYIGIPAIGSIPDFGKIRED